MAHRVLPQAATDLDDIWYYVAKENGRIAVANHLIDSMTDRFFPLAVTFRKSYSNASAKGACVEIAMMAQPCVVYENAEPCLAGCRTEIKGDLCERFG